MSVIPSLPCSLQEHWTLQQASNSACPVHLLMLFCHYCICLNLMNPWIKHTLQLWKVKFKKNQLHKIYRIVSKESNYWKVKLKYKSVIQNLLHIIKVQWQLLMYLTFLEILIFHMKFLMCTNIICSQFFGRYLEEKG